MIISQTTFELSARERGVHLVTDEILDHVDVAGMERGILSLFIQHTSASLTLNENASPAVRRDFERWFRRTIPDGDDDFEHTTEGPDDMPAHIKASLMGPSLSLPIRDSRLALGTWQGIYLCEHRERGGARSIVATAWGEAAAR
jgi:secondary thiamine-phosphate synthase enzyme